MNDDNRRDDRPKFQGDWKCCDCGAAITELPFEPRDTENLRCFECHKKNRPQRNDKPQRQMYDNNREGWQCSECGGRIDKLPFDPRDTSTLKCRDCFQK